MTDEILWDCNETELLQLARTQGLGLLRRGLPREELIALVAGECEPSEGHRSGTVHSRKKLQVFLQANMSQLRSMLPGCDGMCTRFPCTEGRHALCFVPSEGAVQ